MAKVKMLYEHEHFQQILDKSVPASYADPFVHIYFPGNIAIAIKR